MQEELLHHIWNYQRFTKSKLQTTEGESVLIHKSGVLNKDSGPDFFNALITIGETQWAGNVEIHVKSSDWFKHNHQSDKAYSNIVLHVVWEDDIDFFSKQGIATIELKYRVPKLILERYRELNNLKSIPCENLIHNVDAFMIRQWLMRLATERLEQKSKVIIGYYNSTNSSWSETFYWALARNFGFKVNGEPFELLAKSLPLSILAKHKDNPMQVEALIFGQSGLLDAKFKDEYPQTLQKEYSFLKRKYSLKPLLPEIWKRSKMRPSNFPTIRIAQFSALIVRAEQLFSKVLSTGKISETKIFFEELEPSNYWKYHYSFDGDTRVKRKILGEASINNILINTIAPLLFAYGHLRDELFYKERAIELLEMIPSESNNIIKRWKALHLEVENAADSQALIQLRTMYCNEKKCLNCNIGNQILKPL